MTNPQRTLCHNIRTLTCPTTTPQNPVL
jgi:hypothetical protein